jgi:hypothetical protein
LNIKIAALGLAQRKPCRFSDYTADTGADKYSIQTVVLLEQQGEQQLISLQT